MCQDEKNENILYLANSKDLIKYIKKLKVDGLYPNLHNEIPDEDSNGTEKYFQVEFSTIFFDLLDTLL
jgi:hypothetical protein